MNLRRTMGKATLVALLVWGLAPRVWACAACYGQQSDSPMASGMNWGIISLLGVILAVLGGLATAFFLLVRKSGSALAFGEEGGPELVVRGR